MAFIFCSAGKPKLAWWYPNKQHFRANIAPSEETPVPAGMTGSESLHLQIECWSVGQTIRIPVPKSKLKLLELMHLRNITPRRAGALWCRWLSQISLALERSPCGWIPNVEWKHLCQERVQNVKVTLNSLHSRKMQTLLRGRSRTKVGGERRSVAAVVQLEKKKIKRSVFTMMKRPSVRVCAAFVTTAYAGV